jgi:hypothetical protein
MINTMTTAPDEVLDEYTRLSTMNVIEDVKAHAEDWRNLAIKAACADRMATADNCMSRVKYWLEKDSAAYIRLVEGSFSELLQTAPHPAEQVRYCPKCKHVLRPNDAGWNTFDCGFCRIVLLEPETDTYSGETRQAAK